MAGTHFSMIRGFHLADLFTIANGFCGVGALFPGHALPRHPGARADIPTSIVPLALLLLAFHREALYPVQLAGVDLHLVSLLFLLSGSLMISKTLRIPKP